MTTTPMTEIPSTSEGWSLEIREDIVREGEILLADNDHHIAVTIDMDERHIVVAQARNGETGVSQREHDGRDRSLSIPPTDMNDLTDLMEELRPLFDAAAAVYSTEYDGNNTVARWDDGGEAIAAIESRLQNISENYASWIDDVDGWFEAVSDEIRARVNRDGVNAVFAEEMEEFPVNLGDGDLYMGESKLREYLERLGGDD